MQKKKKKKKNDGFVLRWMYGTRDVYFHPKNLRLDYWICVKHKPQLSNIYDSVQRLI